VASASSIGIGPRAILALDQLHDQKRLAAGIVLEAIDSSDMRVIEGGECVRLALKSHEPIGVAGSRSGQELQRDGSGQPGIVGAIDLAHPTGAKQFDDLVRIHPRAGVDRHRVADYTCLHLPGHVG
jgi:hypothetical protein